MLKLDKEIEIFSPLPSEDPIFSKQSVYQSCRRPLSQPSSLGRRPHASEARPAVSPVAGKREGITTRAPEEAGSPLGRPLGITRKKDIGLSTALKRISFRRI